MSVTKEYLEKLLEEKRKKLKQAMNGEIALPKPLFIDGQIALLNTLIQDSTPTTKV